MIQALVSRIVCALDLSLDPTCLSGAAFLGVCNEWLAGAASARLGCHRAVNVDQHYRRHNSVCSGYAIGSCKEGN